MDIYCPLCGEPWDMDELHEVEDTDFDTARKRFRRDGCVVFFRNRTTGGIGDLPDLVHQTAMYHEDRLGGGGFTRVILAGGSVLGGEDAERFRRLLEERIGMRVEPIDFRPAAEMRDRITPSPELLDMLAPAVGVLLRDRVARRTPPAASPTERVA